MNTHTLTPENGNELSDVIAQTIVACTEPDFDITVVKRRTPSGFGYNLASTVTYHVLEGHVLHWQKRNGRLTSRTLGPGDEVTVPAKVAYSNCPLENKPVIFITVSTPRFDTLKYVTCGVPKNE